MSILSTPPRDHRSTIAQAINSQIGDWPRQPWNRNVARYTEDLSWIYVSVSNALIRSGAVKCVSVGGNVIALERVQSANFFASIEQRYGNASLTPFVSGQQYLISMYCYADNDQWFYQRPVSGTGANGHGQRLVRGGTVNRVWTTAVATSTTALDLGENPSVALGSGSGDHPHILRQGSQPLDMWVGGIQIEPISNTARDGVALIGDSTMAGASGKLDLPKDFSQPENAEVSTYLAALLNCSVFNRAVGGERLDQMGARWAVDITPLAARSKYVIIQGGINDISQGRTLTQMQASINSMLSKAQADGLTPVLLNCTPTSSISADPAKESLRAQLNEWLATLGAVDIASVACNPSAPSLLDPAGYGDGVHYTGVIKRRVALAVSTAVQWDLPVPSAYCRIDARRAGAGNAAAAGIIDRSGTVTTGGVAQTLMSANSRRTGVVIENTSAGDLWINELGSTAVAAAPSMRLAAGARYERIGSGVPVAAIGIYGVTTGQAFTAREW